MDNKIQNIAGNLQASNKQHNLFAPVKSVNFPILSSSASANGIQVHVQSTTIEQPGQPEQSEMKISVGTPASSAGSSSASSSEIGQNWTGGDSPKIPLSPWGNMGSQSGHNSHLYGLLALCKKQYVLR